MRFRPARLAYRLLFVVGIAVLAWTAGSVLYSRLYESYLLSKFEQPPDPPPEGPHQLQEGDLIGKLEIPKMGISVMVLQGVEENTLGVAAGHVPGTSLPGGDGNSAIAAHRDTFFRKLRNIRSGDSIRVSTQEGTFGYFVTTTEIVKPEATEVLQSRGYPELTLITCYPFYFVGAAPERFIVHARLQADAIQQ